MGLELRHACMSINESCRPTMHAELVQDIVHHGSVQNGGGGGGSDDGVEHVMTMPQFSLQSGGRGGQPAFATAGQGVVQLWKEDGPTIYHFNRFY
eukprot:6274641-Ditylum_brightwellii.AAC.1